LAFCIQYDKNLYFVNYRKEMIKYINQLRHHHKFI